MREMAELFWKWIEMVRMGWKLLGKTGNGCKCSAIAVNGWRPCELQEMVKMNGGVTVNGCKCLNNGWTWLNRAVIG